MIPLAAGGLLEERLFCGLLLLAAEERALLELIERLTQLLARVHDDRAVPLPEPASAGYFLLGPKINRSLGPPGNVNLTYSLQ